MDSNTTQQIINNSDIIFPYFVTLIIALLLTLYWFRDRVFQKFAKQYFDEEISKELKNYKREFFSLLQNAKLANKFKEQDFLILNDTDKIIEEIAYMTNYIHQQHYSIDDEIKELSTYYFIALYIPPESNEFDPVVLFDKYVDKFLSKLNRQQTILFIYHKGRLNSKKLNKIPVHYSFVNSKLILVEKFENAYMIKNIIDLGFKTQ